MTNVKETLPFQNNLEAFLFGAKRKEIWQMQSGQINRFNDNEIIIPGVSLFLMKDHDGAGKIWDFAYEQQTINHATLLHVDAHDDLAFRLPLPATFTQLQESEFQVGSFIVPRINLGIISKMIWVFPRNMRDAYARHPQVEITKEIPVIEAELIDIDLDFFTYNLPIGYPNFLLKQRAKRFLSDLFKLVTKPKIITVATSPGYIKTGTEKPLVEAVVETFSEHSWASD